MFPALIETNMIHRLITVNNVVGTSIGIGNNVEQQGKNAIDAGERITSLGCAKPDVKIPRKNNR